MVTRLLQETEYVCYEPVTVDWNGRLYRGCRSQNFLREGEELLPLDMNVETYEPAQGAPWYSSQEWKRMRAAVMDQALSYPYLFDSQF